VVVRIKKFLIIGLTLLFVFSIRISKASATSFLYDWAFNVDGAIYEFMAGDSMPTTGALDGEGLGTLTWTTDVAGSHNFIAFFDHEIDEAINTFFNEYGEAIDTPTVTQSWEIDEPGYLFGDIYDHVLAGSLDNTNAVPEATPDDVSWAIGWDFDLVAEESATITLNLSDTTPTSGFYLAQTDPDFDETIYYSSTIDIISVAIPEPGTMILFGSLLLGIIGGTNKKIFKI
jgi:hypothetical protein